MIEWWYYFNLLAKYEYFALKDIYLIQNLFIYLITNLDNSYKKGYFYKCHGLKSISQMYRAFSEL